MKQNSFSYEQLIDCAKGMLFGKGNAQLPMPPMLMFDRIININKNAAIQSGNSKISEEFHIKIESGHFSHAVTAAEHGNILAAV